jgi:hypothetical protein
VAAEHADLAGEGAGIARHVAHVRVAGDQSQRALLAAAADHDLRPACLHGPGQVAGVIEPVVRGLAVHLIDQLLQQEHRRGYVETLHALWTPTSRF